MNKYIKELLHMAPKPKAICAEPVCGDDDTVCGDSPLRRQLPESTDYFKVKRSHSFPCVSKIFATEQHLETVEPLNTQWFAVNYPSRNYLSTLPSAYIPPSPTSLISCNLARSKSTDFDHFDPIKAAAASFSARSRKHRIRNMFKRNTFAL